MLPSDTQNAVKWIAEQFVFDVPQPIKEKIFRQIVEDRVPRRMTSLEIAKEPHHLGRRSDFDFLMPHVERYAAWLEQGEPKKRLAAFIECVGPRHADSRLETYRADTPEQAAVLNAITDYCQNIAERVKSGCGIIANGTVGTGKTHLLIGAGRKAIAAGFRVSYHNGQKLISDFRSRMGDDDAPSEADILDNLVRPDVLILDDPIRPHGQLSDYQEQLFYVFTEGRYNAMKPTWVSMNVDSREDAIKRIGAAIVDRWKDNALTLAFDWPSYRHAGEFKS